MEFRILGPLEVANDAGLVALGGPLPRALLAMLLLHANQPVPVERLAAALWGEERSAGTGRTLQVYISRLRKALGERDRLVIGPAGYLVRVRADELDADRFERLVAEGCAAMTGGQLERAASQLREALSLWRGPALAELASVWLAPVEVARLEERRLLAVEARVEAELGLGRHAELVPELQGLVAEQPWRERLHAQLMLALYRAGRQADALDAYRYAREALVEQLGVEPGRELKDLQQAILAHDPGLEPPHAGVPPPSRRAGALPAPSTALLGREADLDRVAVLINEHRSRLVTLVGPGGVGKTRVAIEAARRLGEDFRHGARFVALASTSEASDFASTVVRTLSAPVRRSESAPAALQRFLANQRMLLVLDNFEHLMPAAREITELLIACPDLTLLVTSREPLRLAAERLQPVRPLVTPTDAAPLAPIELARYSAVALFLDRALARDPEFALDEVTSPHVRRICRRLEGLPLALELAAARLGVLSPAELADRLDEAFTVLAAGTRDAPERHRTLRAAIDWSYDLLTGAERRAFAQLAVFPGGATVAAAESVTRASLDTLDSLTAKQLVRRNGRLLMFEAVREYAIECLAEDPERDAVHARFAAWCENFLRQATPQLRRPERALWLTRLDAESPNLVAALAWALETQQVELALRLVADLGTYWWQVGRWYEGLSWIGAALGRAEEATPQTHARALLARARLTHRRDLPRYQHDLEAALHHFRRADDVAGMALCLAYLASAQAWMSGSEHASALIAEARSCAQRAGDDDAISTVLQESVLAAHTYDEAAQCAEEAVPHQRRIGDLVGLAFTCSITGYLAIAEERSSDALQWLQIGRQAARQARDLQCIWHVRGNDGLAWLFLQRLDAAADAFSEALALSRDVGRESQVDELLLGAAAVAAKRGEFARAARLTGAAKSRTVARSRPEQAVWEHIHRQILTPAREHYGRETWDRREREGASLGPIDATALACT